MNNKKHRGLGKLIKAVYTSYVYVYTFCTSQSGIIPYLLG